jgi:hypothetical protein
VCVGNPLVERFELLALQGLIRINISILELDDYPLILYIPDSELIVGERRNEGCFLGKLL